MNQPKLFDDDKPRRRQHPQDELWNAAIEEFYRDGIPRNLRAYVNKLVWELRDLKATPEKLRRRVAIWPHRFQGCTCTLQAVVNQWGVLRPDRPRSHPGIDAENDAGFQQRLKAWREW